MREIKFRAWDKKEKRMFPVFDLRWKTNGDFLGGGDTWFGECSMAPAEKWSVEVMQYTGLKDKNGKEIYEGDIVEYKYLNTLEQETRKSEVQLMSIGDVNRNIQAYYPFCYSIAGSYKEDNREITECYLTPSDACEIIGNIYENPELLSGN